MEVKPGYKQTEVGIIPDEWEIATATEACDLVVDCKNRTPPVVADSEYAVVRTPNVRNGLFVLEDLRFTDEASYHEWTARAVPQFGDIMITREAPLGEVCAVPSGRKVCLGQRMMLYRPAPDKTHSDYLLYSLMSFPVRANLLRKIGGSTVGHARVDDIRFLQLPLPPLPEQRAIATALGDVDALLAGLDRLIAKKRDLKQTAIQQLLTGQTRLPGFCGEWEGRRLGETGTFLKGSGVKKDEANSGELPCIRYGEIYTHHNDYVRSFNSWISPEVAATATRLRQGDLLFAGSGETKEEIGKCVAFIDDREAFAGGDIVILRLAEANPMFMGYYCNTAPINAQKASKGQGDAVVHISAAAVSSIEVSLPSKDEQTAIAAVLSDMDAELSALQARRDKTRDLKQAMMQELLTGKTRLVSTGADHA